MKTPIQDRWHWVRIGKNWRPAIWIREWAGQGFHWSNHDTWFDFDKKVEEWKLIPLPDELP